MDALIEDVAERIFRDHCDKATLDAAEAGQFPTALWGAFAGAGLQHTGSEASGTGLEDLFGLLTVAGRHAAPLPLAEALLANRLIGAGGDGLVSIAVEGVAPWGRRATQVLLAESGVVVVGFQVAEGANLAGEPRDRISGGAAVGAPLDVSHLDVLLALSRAALMAGAMERLLELAVRYAGERRQFGRPIARFQAVQQSLAVLAAETAAAQRATAGAVAALATEGFSIQVAAAKARVGEAAGVVAEIAHQVHGAMGFTHEHTLHHFTRRLWAWRDEHGAESAWQAALGAEVARCGADGVWAFLSRVEA